MIGIFAFTSPLSCVSEFGPLIALQNGGRLSPARAPDAVDAVFGLPSVGLGTSCD